ncbi:hypothetical protein MNV49_001137 [Pseudohyphozyma bogoriensis]|nr:hypothetical protein MNV49_001137 [Pseudohyphozyma bogoriensis]
MSTSLLLPGFIVSETSRAVIAFAVLHSGVTVSPGLVTLEAESTKLLVALVCWWRLGSRGRSPNSTPIPDAVGAEAGPGGRPAVDLRAGIPYAVPAAMYLVNNLIYFTSLRLAPPSLVHVVMMAKLPLTAILHHLIITPQRNRYAWYSLIGICVGMAIFATPDAVFRKLLFGETAGVGAGVEVGEKIRRALGGGTTAEVMSPAALFGVALAFAIAVISAATGITTELLLKRRVDFWVAQIWLYFYGALFSLISLLLWDGSKSPSSTPIPSPPPLTALFYNLVLIASTAGTGLIIATILRQKDNLVKLVGSSACITTILLAQPAFFPALRKTTLNFRSIASVGGIAVAAWTYHFYKQVPVAPSGYVGGSPVLSVRESVGGSPTIGMGEIDREGATTLLFEEGGENGSGGSDNEGGVGSGDRSPSSMGDRSPSMGHSASSSREWKIMEQEAMADAFEPHWSHPSAPKVAGALVGVLLLAGLTTL